MVYDYRATVLFIYKHKNDLNCFKDYDGFSEIVSLPYKFPRIGNRYKYNEADYNMVKTYLTPWMMEEASKFMPDYDNYLVTNVVLHKLIPLFGERHYFTFRNYNHGF